MKPKNPKTKNNPPTKTASDQDFFQELNSQHGGEIFPKSSAPIYALKYTPDFYKCSQSSV